MVLAAAAVAALASAGSGLLQPPTALDPEGSRAIRIAGAAAVALGLLALVVQRRRLWARGERDLDPPGGSVLKAAVLMGVVTMMALLRPPAVPGGGSGEGLALGGNPTVSPDAPEPMIPPPPPELVPMTEGFSPEGSELDPDAAPPPAPEARQEPPPPSGVTDWSLLREIGRWLLILLVAVLGILTILALTGGLRRRRVAFAPDDQVDAERAEEGLMASLEEVARPGDPRWQIAQAYQRLLVALSAAGAPREPWEAPHEHLHRALGPLGVRPEPLHRLATLYVLAQFSEHPIAEEHRSRAAEALEQSLADLAAFAGVTADAEDWGGTAAPAGAAP